MIYSFDGEIAKICGTNSAVLFYNIYFWIEKNRVNNKHYYDGAYWTYNSKSAFQELFPFMTYEQIKYSLEKLIENNLIKTGNYNKLPMDRTLWYSITDRGYKIIHNGINKNNHSIKEKSPTTLVKNPQAIPYINTDNKTNNNICPSNDEQDISSLSLKHNEVKQNDYASKEEDTNLDDFEKIWIEYPRKEGKSKAYSHYLKWIKGKKYMGKTVKLDRVAVWKAVINYQEYIEKNNIQPQFIKMGSTFFNESIMEFLADEDK